MSLKDDVQDLVDIRLKIANGNNETSAQDVSDSIALVLDNLSNLGSNYYKTVIPTDAAIAGVAEGATVLPIQDGVYVNYNNLERSSELCIFVYASGNWIKRVFTDIPSRTSVKNLAPDEGFNYFPDLSSQKSWRDLFFSSTNSVSNGVLTLDTFSVNQTISTNVTGSNVPLINEDFIFYARIYIPAGFSASAPFMQVFVFHSGGVYVPASKNLEDLTEGWHDLILRGNLSDNLSGGATNISYLRLDIGMRASGVKLHRPTLITGRDVALVNISTPQLIDGIIEINNERPVKGDLIRKETQQKAIRNISPDERFENFPDISYLNSWRFTDLSNTYTITNGILTLDSFTSSSQLSVNILGENKPLITDEYLYLVDIYIPSGFSSSAPALQLFVFHSGGFYAVGGRSLSDLTEGWKSISVRGNLSDENTLGATEIDNIRLDCYMQEVGVKIRKPTLIAGRDLAILEAPKNDIRAADDISIWGDSLTALNWGALLESDTGRNVFSFGYGGQKSYYIRDKFFELTTNKLRTQIFWVGRNNYTETDFVIDDIRTMVNSLSHNRFIVMLAPNGGYGDFADEGTPTGEMKGGSDYAKFEILAERLRSEYPDNFIDNRKAAIQGYNMGGITLNAPFIQPVLNNNVQITVSDTAFLSTENASDAANYPTYSNHIRIGNLYDNDKYEIISVDSANLMTVKLISIGLNAEGVTVDNILDGSNVAYLKVIQELDYQMWVNDTTLSTYRTDSIHMNEIGKQFISDLISKRLTIQKI